MKFHVTLKATVKRGTFYWVTDVEADNEEEALIAAEHKFEAQTEAGDEWVFDEFDVEQA